MQTYFKDGYNGYTLRVESFPSNRNYLSLQLQDMTTQANHAVLFNPGQWSYDSYESFVSFSVDLDTATSDQPTGAQFRATLTPGIKSGSEAVVYDEPVWHGSWQFFTSQSIDKTEYTNQIPLSQSYTSVTSSNSYIIY